MTLGELKTLKFGEYPIGTIPSQSAKEGVETMNYEAIRGAVIGMVLGDGCITKNSKCNNYHLDISHSAKSEGYLKWKVGILEQLVHTRFYKMERKGNSYPTNHKYKVVANTRVHPMFSKLKTRFYHNGRKTVDEFLMKALTPLGLAIWYQDDGYLTNHEDFLTVGLSTCSFNVAEHQLISRCLVDKFGLEFRYNKLNNKHLVMRLRRKDREKFFDLIAPYIHEEMKYKMRDDGKKARTEHPSIISQCVVCGENIIREYKRRNRPNTYHENCYLNRNSITGVTH